MIFNSIAFLIFLPVVFILYWFVFNRNLKWQNVLLLVASYFFYGCWSWKFLGLLALSTLLDFFYGFGVATENPRKSKFFIWLSVVNNLGILAIFKYYDFFAKEFTAGLSQIGFHVEPYLLNLALPIGISFYTFHGMSYVFDIYRKTQKPVNNIVDYAVFVSFFPLLVAGPIERASHLLPQIQKSRYFDYNQSVQGLKLILWGMFKKVVIADGLSDFVNDSFLNYEFLGSSTLFLGALAFSIQIYCDFSGYSDIAIGVAKLLGIELLSNFRFPYFSKNIPDFWKRWHISLTSWFRDYLYIPLGGSKKSLIVTIRNTFIVFFISGIWHGSSWNFIIWGIYHSLFFLLSFFLITKNNKHNFLTNHYNWLNFFDFFKILGTFIVVTIGWIFFRSTSVEQSLNYINRLFIGTFDMNQILFNKMGWIVLFYSVILFFFDWKFRKSERNITFFRSKGLNYIIFIILSIFVIRQYNSHAPNFIYFQF